MPNGLDTICRSASAGSTCQSPAAAATPEPTPAARSKATLRSYPESTPVDPVRDSSRRLTPADWRAVAGWLDPGRTPLAGWMGSE